MEKLDIRKLKSVLSKGGNYRTLAIAFVVLLIFYPLDGNFKYKYKVGAAWRYETLEAPFDFPILKSEKELNAEKSEIAKTLIPYYVVDGEVVKGTIETLSERLRGVASSEEISLLSDAVNDIYSKGVRSESDARHNATSEVVFVENKGTATQKLWGELYTPAHISEALTVKFSASEFSSKGEILQQLSAFSFLPNLQYDKITTDKLHRAALDNISPTKGIVYTGEFIVAEGEIVTEEIAQILDSYRSEFKKNVGYEGSLFPVYVGHILLIIALFLLIYIAIYFSDYQILRRQNEFNFVIFAACLNFILLVLVRRFAIEYIFMMPMAVTALYLYAFVLNRAVIPLYLISLLPILLFFDNGVELFLVQAVAGAVAFITYSFHDRGWQQFLNGFYIFVAMLLVHVAYTLSITGNFLTALYSGVNLHLLINALLVVLSYHLVVVLERLFRMVASSSYRDWADTENRLLRALQQKAPGTFQHVLQVANLSERAIIAIGGNSKLVRVGALYHDIGKLLNPQAFTENQRVGADYHSQLSPEESASIIIRHVDDGLTLANKYKIPKIISNFIITHHAKSMTEYFYNTYCNNGGDPANKAPFTYNGELPSTKEEAVVMLADAVEAASRSLSEYSEKSISDLVDAIVDKRLQNNMLERADISFKEIGSVKRVFKRLLGEIYHTRIAYPKRAVK